MIRISHTPVEIQDALRALDKKVIDEYLETQSGERHYPFYKLCFCCKMVVLGINTSFDDQDSEGYPTCFNGQGCDVERLCPTCEQYFIRFNIDQPNKNTPLFNKLPPKEKLVFPNGQNKILGDALLDWLIDALTFYKKSCWSWSHKDGWTRKPIYNVAPFQWEYKSIPGPGRPQTTLNLMLFVPGKNPKYNYRVVGLKYSEDLSESFHAFKDQIKEVLKHTTVEHRKRWKKMLEDFPLPH